MKKILSIFLVTNVLVSALIFCVGPKKETQEFFEYDKEQKLAELRRELFITFFGEEYIEDDLSSSVELDLETLEDIFAAVRKRKQNVLHNSPEQIELKKEIQELDEDEFENL